MLRHAWYVTAFVVVVPFLAAAAQDDARPVYYHNPDWSPDGTKLVFESTRDGSFAIYTMNVDGTGLRQLTTGEADNEQPRWSPAGDRIVFISNRDGHLQLYVMNTDGTEQRRLTHSDALDYNPAWSPNGEEVVFVSRADPASVIHDLVIVRADGTGRRSLTADSTVNDMGPSWSADGTRIAFMRNVPPKRYYRDMSREELGQMQHTAEIFVISPDGTELFNLTGNDVRDCCVYWSADGQQLYFHSLRDEQPGIYAMNADGSNVRRVADGNQVPDPRISPDGNYFAYTKESDGVWGVYLYALETGEEALLIGGS